ncbi:MAG: glycosyltransferase family 2 protein [Proteobacteria bacterium]|nr:glycosyltransferase family 2 protein [Pseudomonadota bacterium]
MTEHTTESPTWAGAEPALSVLIPFHGDDPRPLLEALDRQAAGLDGRIEIVVLDDGDPDRVRAGAVAADVAVLRAPARLVSVPNEGRARGRNRLARHARSERLLFLDSDMLPDDEDFLQRWAHVEAPVAFGGFTVDGAPVTPHTVLHQAMSRGSDCLPAAHRSRAPEKHVFTSNLLVRREVFECERFDESFTGWGWEDVEWAMRVGRRWPILHIDNTATHLGLDTAETLTRKYEQSAGNFARVLQAHPEIVARYASFRAARVLRRAPLRGLWRPMLKRLAVATAVPLKLRVAAAKTYRAACYAEVL